jgi:solute carrier family 6 GABA transporter-like protein 1
VFYSTGVGFGYYTAYASYNQQHSNAAQDSVILVFTNAFLEATLAFAAFGIVGFMGLTPDPEHPMGSYSLGFMTYPEAFVQMPGSNFWSALFFITLGVVGVSSTFVMLDAVMTLIMDSALIRRKQWRREWVATALVTVVFLLSLPNCTEFGYAYVDGIDRWINNVGLVFVVWAECVGATTIYRFEDVIDQVGMVAFATYNISFFGAQLLSLIIGHTVGIEAGAGVGFGIFFIGSIVSVLIAKTPTTPATARIFCRNNHAAKIYYLAFYSVSSRYYFEAIQANVSTGQPAPP